LEKIKKEWNDWKNWGKNYKFHIGHIPVFSDYNDFETEIEVMAEMQAKFEERKIGQKCFT